MASTILLKRTSNTGVVPSANAIGFGELFLNYHDGILYFKTAGNVVVSFSLATANIANAAANTVASFANGNIVLAAANLNFNNTATVNVSLTANGNAQVNVAFTANIPPYANVQFSRPVTGFNANITSNLLVPVIYYIMQPAGTIASGTVTMPTVTKDGQEVVISSGNNITAFTLLAANGQTIQNVAVITTLQPPATKNQTSLFQSTRYRFVYVVAANTWFGTGPGY